MPDPVFSNGHHYNGHDDAARQLLADLSSHVRPRRAYPGAVPPPGDEAAEELLRARLARQVADLLAERSSDGPRAPGLFSPQELATIETAIDEAVAAHQLEQASLGLPVLRDPAGAQQRLRAALVGMDVLQTLCADPDVEDICVDDFHTVDVFVRGEPYVAEGIRFRSEDHLRQFAVRLVETSGGQLDDSHPLAESELPDGSRLAAALPPIAPRGTCLTIRKYSLRNHTPEDLIDLGAASPAEVEFLSACVRGGINLVFAGATGMGKTSFLNAFGSVLRLDPRARVAVLEDVLELDLPHTLPSVVHHRTRRPNGEGAGEVTLNDLVRFSLRERITHLIIGEMRGREANEVLKALSSDHHSLTTCHGGDPLGVLERIVELAREASSGATTDDLRRLVARQFPVIVQLGRHWATDRRQILEIFELEGLQLGQFSGHTLWDARADDGRPVLRNTPACLERLARQGVHYTPPPVGATSA